MSCKSGGCAVYADGCRLSQRRALARVLQRRSGLFLFCVASLWGWSAAAQPPSPHFVVAPGASTVSDTATKLTWQRNAPAKTYDWTSAGKYCADLQLDGKGWRLPTVKELQTLVDETRTMPAIDPMAFPHTAPDYYRTSSQVPGFTTQSWTVSFAYGFDGFYGADTLQHVRCVR